MSYAVTFVAAIGRMSRDSHSARPKIEAVVAKHGGRVVGGEGSSQDPIRAEFAEEAAAAACAQEAIYNDDIEDTRIIPGNTSMGQLHMTESAEKAGTAIAKALDAVTEGGDVAAAVDAFLAEDLSAPNDKEAEEMKKEGDEEAIEAAKKLAAEKGNEHASSAHEVEQSKDELKVQQEALAVINAQIAKLAETVAALAAAKK